MLALVPATSCTTKQDVTRSEPNDSAVGPPPRLRFQTVRSILEDSKGNYWFGSWEEGVCRFDGKSLTYFTVKDGLSDNQIRSIHEDRNGVVWFDCGVGISGFDGEKIITPTNRNYTAEEGLTSKQIMGIYTDRHGDLWLAGNGVFKFNGASFDRIH